MTPCEEQFFSYSDLPRVAPWLNRETCQQLTRAGLFTPRMVREETGPENPCMYVYELIALTAMQQLLRCGISTAQLRKALYDTSGFRCGDFSKEDLIFLSTGCLRGQELSRFLEVTDADVTILVRHFLDRNAEIEFIPKELLGSKDYRGETLTHLECKAIRDLIETNTAFTNATTSKRQNGR
ncbi:MAG: hypothetical protein ACLQPD_06590 [Desulfomonilaceae bacterium]